VSGQSSPPLRRPTLEEFRAVVQPPALVDDVSREHWMGRRYMRRLSVRLTRRLAPTRTSPDAVTWGMVLSGLAAAGVLAVPAVWATLVAAVLVQVQVLFDCSDGELARWRGTSSPRGIFLDRFGHYTTDAAVVAAVGVHADGGFGSIDGWTTVGLAAAVLVLVSRAETDLVHVARSAAGLARVDAAAVPPRAGGLRAVRSLVYRMPVNRLLMAWDLSAVLVLVAVTDAVADSLVADQVLSIVLVGVGALVVIGHLVSILASGRLR
jgi:phosphatidylglycerophosphate synthase